MSAQVPNPPNGGRTLTKEPHRTPTMEESTTSRLARMEDKLDHMERLIYHSYKILYAQEQKEMRDSTPQNEKITASN